MRTPQVNYDTVRHDTVRHVGFALPHLDTRAPLPAASGDSARSSTSSASRGFNGNEASRMICEFEPLSRECS